MRGSFPSKYRRFIQKVGGCILYNNAEESYTKEYTVYLVVTAV